MRNPTKNENIDTMDKWTLEKGVKYELTICPSDKYQFEGKERRDKKIFNLFSEIFLSIKAVYCLYAEISAPQYGDIYFQSIPRIHWHGIIEFENNGQILDWLLYHHSRLCKVARIQLNNFRPDYWPKYITKHRHLFERLKIDIINDEYLLQDSLDKVIEVCGGKIES